MKANYLFPTYYRPLGWLMTIIGSTLGYFYLYREFKIPSFDLGIRNSRPHDLFDVEMNLTDELALTMLCLGLLFIAFSKLREEDELTAKIRLDALRWGVFVNYILIILVAIGNNLYLQFNGGSTFLNTWNIISDLNWIIYTYFSPLIVFIFRFYYQLHRYRKEGDVATFPKGVPAIPFRPLGIGLTILTGGILAFSLINDWIEVMDETGLSQSALYISWYLLPLGLILWVFSPNRNSDEYWQQIRLESWQISIYIYYGIILMLSYTVYGLPYLTVLLLTMPALPLLYILVFNVKRLNIHSKPQYRNDFKQTI